MEEEKPTKLRWQTLRNPFNYITDSSESATGLVTGRSTDIAEIITGAQNAIILSGAPSIGKSTLIRYLQRFPQERSWRDELVGFYDQQKLKNIQFVQIDLTNLEGIGSKDELLTAFVKQCAIALQSVCQKRNQQSFDLNLKGLIEMLRSISQDTTNVRYLIMLDNLERLKSLDIQIDLDNKAPTLEEYGLALLDTCRAIRTMVNLIDEFAIFGVILSIQSLPRSKSTDRLTHVSADLARFKTMTLQTFTWDDAEKFLAQGPENFGTDWASNFEILGGKCIFSKEEQTWLREQAGTHPYLLHQFCIQTFDLKQKYANKHEIWIELQERDKRQLVDRINESLSTFFAHIWNRLQDAIDKSSRETKEEVRSKFYDFISLLVQKQAKDVIDLELW